MAEKTETIFVIWDFEDREARFRLLELEKHIDAGLRGAGLRIVAPRPIRWDRVLDRDLLPGIQAADRVLVVLSRFAEYELDSFLFQIGLALGYGKQIGFLSLQEVSQALQFKLTMASRHFLEPWGIEIFREPIQNIGSIDLSTLAGVRWHPAPTEPPLQPQESVVVCPSLGQGSDLRELLAGHEDLFPLDIASGPVVLGFFPVERLIWIRTATPSLDLQGHAERTAASLLTGFLYSLGLRMVASGRPKLQVFRSPGSSRLSIIIEFEKIFSDLNDLKILLREEEPDKDAEVPQLQDGATIEKLTIHNFKGIEHLEIDFTERSSLQGRWTCIAGINGSGKSAILQAVAMLLLGDRLVAELGGERIRRMPRRIPGISPRAELSAIIRYGSEQRALYLPLSEKGVDRSELSHHAAFPGILDTWESMEGQLLVSYGATRNLSDFRDSRNSDKSPRLHRQMTLFDPLSQVASVDMLLDGGAATAPTQKTLKALLGKVLAGDLAPGTAPSSDRLLFHQGNVDVETIDLPDGFRSSVAWLADLCAAWHQTAPPEVTASCDPADITGIVLIDEIDLHLHPSLQRSLIPRLREALPKVQFIVTTHSPLVLSSFDRAEIVMLDRESEGGIKSLDRQIFAFSTDQVYDWLMGTPPQSTVLDEKLAEGTDPNLPLYLYQSKEKSEEQAKEELEEIRSLREKLLDPAS